MSKVSLAARRKSCNPKRKLKTKTMAILSSSIAHELKNYLAAINICAELSESRLKDIREKVKAANYFINNQLLQIKNLITGRLNREDFIRYSITKNIEEALEQYPFKNDERKLITVDATKDFEYLGNPSLTNHILYNLIKNSLRAIQETNKGKITIKLKPGKKINSLIFRDTASGIPKKFLPKIFDLFESHTTLSGGTGIGLAFCEEIMESYGGKIICRSKKLKYTEFILKFSVCS